MTAMLGPRVPNWDVALVRWAAGMLGRPYAWGSTDCGSLVRGAVEVMYGTDPLPPGLAWDGPRTAAEALRATGGLTALLGDLGARSVALRAIQTGDVLVRPLDDDHPARLGVAVAGMVLLSDPESGVRAAPLKRLAPDSGAWRLPV